MKHRVCSGRFLTMLGLAAMSLWPACLPAQVHYSAPLPPYASSNSAKPGESDMPLPAHRPRAAEEEKQLASTSLSSDIVQVTGVRFLSSKNYTRVMMDLSQNAKYEVRWLKEDPAKGTPPRIYIDIANARMAMASKEPIAVEDGLLRQVRVGQYSAEVVRVVLDMTSLRDHKAFMLPDPHRLVIDVQGQQALPRTATQEERATPEKPGWRSAPVRDERAALPQSNAIGIRKIVLDPGHGGKDPGAVGVGGILEKDLVLSIAKKLAVKLKNDMGVQVVLTRTDDRYLALEDRTYRANAENADLFISLHLNASTNIEARGVETYYLNNTTDEAAMRLAARENGGAGKSVSDLQFILSDMTQNLKLEDSISLAHRLQHSMVSGMGKAVGEVRDLGVKKALFYVLVGARMPSVLVEMYFLTHRVEAPAMSREASQDVLVSSLFKGIQQYSESIMSAKTL